MGRNAKITALVGARGTGKSTKANAIISARTKQEEGKVLIIDTIDHQGYQHIERIIPSELPYFKKGVARMYGSNIEEMLNAVSESYYNGLLVIEDSRKFLGWTLKDTHRAMLIDSKQKGVDILLMFHSFGQFIREITDFIDYIVIFHTQESLQRVKTKIDFENVVEAWKKVQESPNKYENATVRIN